MKSRFVITSFALVYLIGFAILASGQQDSAGMGTANKAANAKEHSMSGCLQKGAEDNTFRLTEVEKGPKTVEIAESTAKLDPHVGHKIEITGTATTGKDPQAHTMKVSSIKMLSPTCP